MLLRTILPWLAGFLIGGSTFGAITLAQSPTLLTQHSSREQLGELLRLGREYVDAGDYPNAIAIYERAASLDNQNPKIFSGIGYLHARQGRFREAVRAYQQALSLDPDNPRFYYALAFSLANTGDYANAATAYYYAIQLEPRDVKNYLGLGVVLLRQGDYEKATEAYQRVIALDPNNQQAFTIMGSALIQQGRIDEAIAYLQNATQRFPRSSELNLQLATAVLQKGEIEKGFQLLQEAERSNPNNPLIQLKIGTIFEQKGNWAGALAAYRRASYLDRRSIEARMGQIRVAIAQKDFLGAVVTATEAIELDPQNPDSYYYLGVALFERGRNSEAKDALKQARQLYQSAENNLGVERVDKLLKPI